MMIGVGTRHIGIGIKNLFQRYAYHSDVHRINGILSQNFKSTRSLRLSSLCKFDTGLLQNVNQILQLRTNMRMQFFVQYCSVPRRMVRDKKKVWCKTFIEFSESIDNVSMDAVMSDLEWGNLEKRIIDETPQFAKALDYSLMKAVCTRDRIPLAKSLLEYIKKHRTPNIATASVFVSTCAKIYPELAINEYEEIKKNNSLMLNVEMEKLFVRGLAYTDDWKKCIEILDNMMCLYRKDIPYNSTINSILLAAVRNNDFNTYFTMLGKYISKGYNGNVDLTDGIFQLWYNGSIPIDVMFQLLKVEDMYLNEEQIGTIADYCKREWSKEVVCEYVTFPRNSFSDSCKACGDILKRRSYMTELAFNDLSQKFYSNVFVGKSIYLKSSPEELNKFSDFLKTQKPYDYVVDGLNVMCDVSGGAAHISRWKKLLSVLRELHEPGKRILVIARAQKYKTAADRKCYEKVLKLATFYDSIHSSSHDDVFMLLAAFRSGPSAYIVSNDNLRDHKALLDPDSISLFENWQRCRHISFNKEMHRGKLYYDVQFPNTFICTTHESDAAWHVPYLPNKEISNNMHVKQKLMFLQPNSFLCIKKKNYTPSVHLRRVLQAHKDALKSHKTNI